MQFVGREEEIALVCEDEIKDQIDFFEVKHDRTRYETDGLVAKVSTFFQKYPKKKEMKHTLGVLSLAEM